MTRILLLGNLLVVAFVCSLSATGAWQAGPDRPLAAELTPEEEKLAIELAELALKEKGLLHGKVYLSKIDVFRDGHDQASPRRVFVTHYRYQGRDAVQTCIDLGRRKVVKVEVLPNFPAPLAPREAARATELARAHPVVKEFLQRHGKSIQLEAFLIRSIIPGEAACEHRVANICFKDGEFYLNEPRVDVDLTTETVILRGPHDKMKK